MTYGGPSWSASLFFTTFYYFLYHHSAPEYKHYMNKEGELKEANREWHRSNGTYPVSYGLGVIIMSIGVLIAI